MKQNQFKIQMQEAQYQALLRDYKTLAKDIKKEKKMNKDIALLQQKQMILRSQEPQKPSKNDKTVQDWMILDNFLVYISDQFLFQFETF